jgi:hypothetical protein
LNDEGRQSGVLAALSDPDTGVLYDLEPESKRLIVAFGGLAGRLGMPPFEFFRTLSGVNVKTVFVRDHAQAWYHRGVAGVGEGIDSVAAHIIGLRAQAEQMVTIGTSAGGYAALLFGALAACEAHAFVPQTFIAPGLREEHRDRRWEAELEALGAGLDPRYADLLPTLAAGAAPAHVYYGSGNRLDRVHAERLDRLPQVTLHPFDTDQHNVVRDLRDSGWLARFLVGLAQGAL